MRDLEETEDTEPRAWPKTLPLREKEKSSSRRFPFEGAIRALCPCTGSALTLAAGQDLGEPLPSNQALGNDSLWS